jgi:hypothetical protein
MDVPVKFKESATMMMMRRRRRWTKLTMTVTAKCFRNAIVAIIRKVYNSNIYTGIAIQSLCLGLNRESLRLPALHALHTSPLHNFSLSHPFKCSSSGVME